MNVKDLTPDEMRAIVRDLVECIHADRLRDCVFGWERTKKGKAKSKGDVNSPLWMSLQRVGLMDEYGRLK